ncbi:acyl carrier protein [Roseimicrobium gellanilyticum]|uniref:Acyl carrier protein n=1 Tax=Roseimicrobium gellanilyticum TaxID=748857 RepID=A0A366HSH5_9BACT|nr:acyl carrier protein [Roseimicrobium gellanilyticum]
MGLDSVELVMAWEEEFGIDIPDEAAAHMFTPADAIDWVCKQVNASEDRDPCFSMVEFHRVREHHFTKLGVPRREVKLQSVLSRGWFTRHTVRDEVKHRVEIRTKALMKRRKYVPQWNRSEVREVVRWIIREQLGVDEFSDKDEFVRDLGLG